MRREASRAYTTDRLSNLESKVCRAICNEIGERLRWDLAKDDQGIPPRLLQLRTELASLDNP